MNEKIAGPLKELIVSIDELIPRERNARQGDVELIKESLQTNGQYRPIVVNKRTGEVLAGNHTLKAAKALGWESIAATFVDATKEEASRIVLVDNRANDVATYENKILVSLIREFDDLTGTGFTNADVTKLLQELGEDASKDGNTDPDDVPDIPENPTTKEGDVWVLGNHRLICGDSTDTEVVSKLMDGRSVDLVLTDPPYGVSYSEKANSTGGTKHKDIANDGLTGTFLSDFLDKAFASVSAVCDAGTPAYVFLSDASRIEFEQALTNNSISVRQVLIWVKQQFVLGRMDYHAQHEPIIYGWKEGAAHKWYGGFDKSSVIDETKEIDKMSKDELLDLLRFIRSQVETTVIKHDRPQKSALHPTTKPVGLLEKLVQNSSQYGEAVLDVFAGSGSTLIACERLGRHGYMVEFDPAYCDVIVKRWEEHTGNKAVLETPAES